jgi:hypothetical protein
LYFVGSHGDDAVKADIGVSALACNAGLAEMDALVGLLIDDLMRRQAEG